jgi:hypothetical protein
MSAIELAILAVVSLAAAIILAVLICAIVSLFIED